MINMKYITLVLAFLLIDGCAHVSTTPIADDKDQLLGSWVGSLEAPKVL